MHIPTELLHIMLFFVMLIANFFTHLPKYQNRNDFYAYPK